ncbi:hypothetical protein [Lactiplantibacillus plantarum]|nr:hypothetical protein [Lactiplantibacillus plantarum]MBS0937901.1 hypothetical protein [Lactiplantibacillus plantarum]
MDETTQENHKAIEKHIVLMNDTNCSEIEEVLDGIKKDNTPSILKLIL